MRLQLFEAIAMLWERASETGPLVVIMEDVHWADESTRHLLRFLARALTDAPVMIIASYRTDELTRRHPLRPFLAEVVRLAGTVRVEVPNLDRAEVAELLSRLLDRPPTNAVIDSVYRRSEGIPYFVEELTRSAARGCIDMPDTLRDALNVRVQALTDEAQETVQLAAVAGNRVEHDLLEAAASASSVDLDRGLREAIDAAVLTTDETGYSFRHALLREVIHDDLLPGQHARLHARIAALLEDRPELVGDGTADLEIAHHWSAAHEINKAFRAAIKVARSGSTAYHETLKMYERALELWDQVDDPVAVAGPRAIVLKQAAVAASDAGEEERALALVTAALVEFGDDDPTERIKALMLQASLMSGLLKPRTVAPLREAMSLLPADADPVLRARVLEALARRLLLGGEIDEGIVAAREAVAASIGIGSAAVESNARNTLATGLTSRGLDDEAQAEWERAGVLARGSIKTELRFFINYSDALNLSGHYPEAVRQATVGIELARTQGLERSIGSMLAGNAAEPMLALGEWDRAGVMIERALDMDPPPNHLAHLRLLRAWLWTWRGQLDEADVILAEFRPMITEPDSSPQYFSQLVRADADHAVATGDHSRAWADVEVFLDRWDTFHASWTFPVLAVGAAAARALDAADGSSARLEQIRAYAERGPHSVIDRRLLAAGDQRRARRHRGRLACGLARAQAAAGAGPSCSVRRTPARTASGGGPGARRGQGGAGRRDRAGHDARRRPAGRSAERVGPAGRVGARSRCGADRRIGTDPARDRGAATGRGRPIQRGDRFRPVHQHEDGQRPRLQHLGQARRQRSRRGRRRRPPPRPRLLTPRAGTRPIPLLPLSVIRTLRPFFALDSGYFRRTARTSGVQCRDIVPSSWRTRVGPVKWKQVVALGAAVGALVYVVRRKKRRAGDDADLWATATDPVDRIRRRLSSRRACYGRKHDAVRRTGPPGPHVGAGRRRRACSRRSSWRWARHSTGIAAISPRLIPCSVIGSSARHRGWPS